MRIRTGHFSRKQLIIAVVFALLVGILIERFVTQGTFLGYQIREVGSPLTNSQEQPSKACIDADSNAVAAILGTDVKRLASNIGDTNKPFFMSVCTYRTDKSPQRSVTVVVREVKNEESAKSQFSILEKRQGPEQLSGLGDQAVFLEKQNQAVVRDGKKIITVTVSKPTSASKMSSKEAARQLAQKLLD